MTLRRRGGSARTSRSWSGRSTAASRWSTSTAPTPRRSRARSRHAEPGSTSGTTPTSHRASHQLGEEATAAYEGARDHGRRVHRRAGPRRDHFTKNVSEALNLVAYSMGTRRPAGAERFRPARVTRSSSPRWSTTPTSSPGSCSASAPARRCAGSASPTTAGWILSNLDELINERTKIVSVVHQSNVLGTINPVADDRRPGPCGRRAACWSTPLSRCRSMPVDVAGLGADFLAFTGHKMCGPTGIGVLWGRRRAARRDCRRSWAAAR